MNKKEFETQLERQCTCMPYFIYERNQEKGWMACAENILALWKQVKE